jgi:hypothetical protein
LLQKNKDPRLAAYVVWVPELAAQERNVGPATALVADPRVKQFWDPGEVVSTEYGHVLGINFAAWDVYMLFDAEQVWRGNNPPRPRFWMHQLGGVTDAPRLEPVEFARRAAELLNLGQ